MSSYQPRSYQDAPPFSPPLGDTPLKPLLNFQFNASDIDMIRADDERTQRAASVLSGMSAEDMEAAETLNSLHANYHSPAQARAPPTHIQTTTSYEADQQEPLLSLLTSTHPLAASLINGSLSVYKTGQSFIPGAEWTERNVGLPLAGKISRVTGVEGGLRWALQSKREGLQPIQGSSSQTRPSDVEKGFADVAPVSHRTGSENSFAESLPAYNDGDRSPPYSEHQIVLQSRERQPPPGWRQQLVISTSGLGVAMSEESLRSLRYCLRLLRWANQRLDGAVQSLRDLLKRWDEGAPAAEQHQPMSLAAITQSQDESRQAALTARIAVLKADVLQTLHQVVDVVSKYAGGALPENARNLVHRHLTSLPQRFSIASAMSSNNANGNEDEATGNANRVMVLAQEGLDMMTQVTGVVNDTLVSAEGWCEKLGRRKRDDPQRLSTSENLEKDNDSARSVTVGRDQDTDVKMEM